MKHHANILVLLCAAALCGCAAQAATPSSGAAPTSPATTNTPAGTSWSKTVQTILAQAKAASGGAAWDNIHSLRSKGTIKAGGLSGSITELDDLLTSRSVTHATLGSYHFAQGFDGKAGWSRSPDGEVSSSPTPAVKMRDATSAYQTERAWWYPKRWPAKIKSLGTRRDDGLTFQVLRIAPRGGNPFELWVNAKTHLINRFVDRSGTVPVTTYFSDYRTVDGVKMPFHQRRANGKKQYAQVVQLEKIAVNAPTSDQDFARPKQHLNDFSFIGGGNEATIPFKLIDNHIHIRVKVNGHPLQFILDSGSVNVLLIPTLVKPHN